MGKNLVQQKRGKGSPTYRSPSFRFKGAARHLPIYDKDMKGDIIDLVHCPGHSAPLAILKYGKEKCIMHAPEGVRVGDVLETGKEVKPEMGNTLALGNIPEGTTQVTAESSAGLQAHQPGL